MIAKFFEGPPNNIQALMPFTTWDVHFKYLSYLLSYLQDYTIKIDTGENLHCHIIFPSEIVS